MASTPRVRSGGFPATPATAVATGRKSTPANAERAALAGQRRQPSSGPSLPGRGKSPLPLVPENSSPSSGGANNSSPLIPLRIIDAPQQRAYALAFYLVLVGWKLHDWVRLVEDNADSLWLFLKWAAIDLVYLFGLPEFRIPWLELSQPFVVLLFFLHVVFNFVLMFNIGLPWHVWLLGVLKVFYDREISISEHSVQVASIRHNQSAILGKQIINILPEGSAILNPDKVPLCLGDEHPTAGIPFYLNATVPIEVELTRIDLDSNDREAIKLSSRELGAIKKLAKKARKTEGDGFIKYEIQVKKPGVYRLSRVLDEYKLQVQRRAQDTFVVKCPKARVRASPSSSRCMGELSDLQLEVAGTPPLKIVGSRTTNGKDSGFHFQSLQPDGFSSPLFGSIHALSPAASIDDDVTWARTQRVSVPLNESMTIPGDWQYTIDEVQDAFGNVVKYAHGPEDHDLAPPSRDLFQKFSVKERPRLRLAGCDTRNPIKVATGKSTKLPVQFGFEGKAPGDGSYEISWLFSPFDSLTPSGDHGDVTKLERYVARGADDRPVVSAPGLYTLKSVSYSQCDGEVQEPSSCLLLNPREPSLMLSSEPIPDTCAGSSVGLRVNMVLDGTPPFNIRYDIIRGKQVEKRKFKVDLSRYQFDLRPTEAGTHRYIFRSVEDAIYSEQSLSGPEFTLEQDVKPAASAVIKAPHKLSACLDDPVELDVALTGEAPFTLEWELVYDGRRKSERVTGISGDRYRLKTPPLERGGEYTVALKSIRDASGCPRHLSDEVKIVVRRQRPRAAFYPINGLRKTTVVEGTNVKLHLRLTGEAPWKVSYRNQDDPTNVHLRSLSSDNDYITVPTRGAYELVDVSDNQCSGLVDPAESVFEIGWFPRPTLDLVESASISKEDGKWIKSDVCEGDIDGFELQLRGSPPYRVEYEVTHQPVKAGSKSLTRRSLDAAIGKSSIQMDTAKAGTYTYKFQALADNLYNVDRNKFSPVVLQQRVNTKPTATFSKPGHLLKYCASEPDDGEAIPITLTGSPPFYVELEIRHNAGTHPETYRIPSITTHNYNIQIPKKHLRLGTQLVRIHKVRDDRGCQNEPESITSPSVQVQFFDAPSIYPSDTHADYCVGDRIQYALSGTPPFEVFYTFDGAQKKAKSSSTTFRRVAESPGEFIITGVSDRASECRAKTNISKTIHPIPAVHISKGKVVETSIHEGGQVEILFEFWGTPPFEFTYTRSTNAKKGHKSQVLETKHEISHESSMLVTASQEGTYEVVAIKDRYCSFSTAQMAGGDRRLLKQ